MVKFLIVTFLVTRGASALGDLPDDPRDLDDYLIHSEAKFSDITPDTQKLILWAGKPGIQTAYSLIYLHGFSSTRKETEPLTRGIAETIGANVFYTRLTGHGRGSDAMLDGNVQRWYDDVREAYEIGRKIGRKVIIVSVSTGGTLATWLASEDSTSDLGAMIMLSPNFALANAKAYGLDMPFRLGIYVAEKQIGKEYRWKPHSERHAKYWTYVYPTKVLRELVRLLKLVDNIDKSKIQTPLLVIYSPGDQVVSVDAIVKTYGEFGSKKKNIVAFSENVGDPSQHILAGDILSPQTTATLEGIIVGFLDSL